MESSEFTFLNLPAKNTSAYVTDLIKILLSPDAKENWTFEVIF